jgi:signal transduction histidine kinase
MLVRGGKLRGVSVPDGELTLEKGPRLGADKSARRWSRRIAIVAAVGIPFFLAAKLGLGLPASSGYVAVFWPAMGLGVGVLIGLGPSERWLVLVAITAANFLANLSSGDPPQIATATCLSEAAECLLPAVLVERWFGAGFSLARLRHVLGLLAAAVIGSAAGAVCWIVTSTLFYGPTGPILTTFQHWFLSDMVGFIATGPFVIQLFASARRPPPRRETIEGVVALLALAILTGTIILLPSWLWEAALPISWLFPVLMWLVARSRPIFAAAAAFLVSITIVSTTVFGIGHFGDSTLTIETRILQAQAAILFVALGALILAALFSERRESERRLAHSNMLLERERGSNLMNLEAMVASISHELKQPLGAIALQGSALRRFLNASTPDIERSLSVIEDIISDSHRAAEFLDSIRILFGKLEQVQKPVDINTTVSEVLRTFDSDLHKREVKIRTELAPHLPFVQAHKAQLQEVMINLITNAIEAMDDTVDRARILQLKTALRHRSIVIEIQDTGQGIQPERLERIFEAFFTTKPSGTGLGLALCRLIIERHGGQLNAISDGKNGAMFAIILPAQI